KRRLHFHEFLVDLHAAIHANGSNLTAALDQLLGGLEVVCFDEFHVHDPADGIFIGRLVSALFDRSAAVVLTSNYPPTGLLPNPLFHDMFVPTIELIEQALMVVPVNGPLDYRTLRTERSTGFAAGHWVSPGHPTQLSDLGLHLPTADEQAVLRPAGHPIPALRVHPDCLWFAFADLCGGTTAPVDYLALADHFPHWVISGVEFSGAGAGEVAGRFSNLVDVLYDRDIRATFISYAPWLTVIKDAPRLPVDVDRISSRLTQLQRVVS
ncbi:MAG: cell division protein ZapE, partial [Rhodococcus sp.]|nr:cell division protein ZapE [Rhodococcus sp. (in: high G+C Gram-positive bacteria)]